MPRRCAQQQEQGSGGFLGGLFGNNNATPVPGGDLGSMSGTFKHSVRAHLRRRLFPGLVRHRLGALPGRREDLQGAVSGDGSDLYAYRNPGEDMNQAVSLSGQPYTALPTAFKFRASHDPACSCKAAGQTWSDALKSVDDKALLDQQGDIIVTEESAKKMQQQKMQAQQPKGAQPAAAKKGAPAPPTTAGTPPAPATDASPAADGKDKPIRSVGPTFIPNNNTTTR